MQCQSRRAKLPFWLGPENFCTVPQSRCDGKPATKVTAALMDLMKARRQNIRGRVTYPQQFVEDLCSAQGMTDTLMREIERVIFEAHPLADRDGAVDFDELLESRAKRFRDARDREEEALADISERIGVELEKQTLVDSLKKQIEEKVKLIARYKNDRLKLVVKGNEARISRLNALTSAAEKVRGISPFFQGAGAIAPRS